MILSYIVECLDRIEVHKLLEVQYVLIEIVKIHTWNLVYK